MLLLLTVAPCKLQANIELNISPCLADHAKHLAITDTTSLTRQAFAHHYTSLSHSLQHGTCTKTHSCFLTASPTRSHHLLTSTTKLKQGCVLAQLGERASNLLHLHVAGKQYSSRVAHSTTLSYTLQKQTKQQRMKRRSHLLCSK